jgi:peroxiredoxin
LSLLSDQQRQWSTHLSLLTFKAGAQEFLRRRTLVVSDGKIVFVRDVIDEPHTDADHLLAWLGVNAG